LKKLLKLRKKKFNQKTIMNTIQEMFVNIRDKKVERN